MIKTEFYVERGPEGEEQEYVLQVHAGMSPYDPGRTSGPMHLCYPPEGGDIDFELFLYGKPWSGVLTEGEKRDLEEKIALLASELEGEGQEREAEEQMDQAANYDVDIHDF